MTTIKELQDEIEKLLKSLDGYGYSREETLTDLEFYNSNITSEIQSKYKGLKSEIKGHFEEKTELLKFIEEERVKVEKAMYPDIYSSKVWMLKFIDKVKQKIENDNSI